ASAFRDINPASPVSNGDYTTGAGWDPVTGLGSVDANQLLQVLGGAPLAQPTPGAFAGSGTYDDTSVAAITYAPVGDWSQCGSGCAGALNGSEHVAANAGDAVYLRFSGPSVSLIYSSR